ncbi:MAG: Mth938-like domain-containing protein [Pseudomonadota bacterium]
MKLTLHTESGVHLVRAYQPGLLRLADREVDTPVLMSPSELVCPWDAPAVSELDLNALKPLLDWHPDICVLGTGPTQAFPPVALIAELAERGIGLEVMRTPAACRTYNVLVVDGRRVAAALIL